MPHSIRWFSVTRKFLLRLCASTLLIGGFFVITQDFHIFPGLYDSKLLGYENKAPKDIDELTAWASDGTPVTVWRLRAAQHPPRAVALLFHGNAEHLLHFYQVQRWLQALGVSTYSVEFRGFDRRTPGWPSEEGFYLDSEAAFKLLQQEENVSAREVVALGSSIGTGTAAYIAQKYQLGTLVLLAPYTSLEDLVSEMPFYGLLAPLLKYQFPSKEYLAKLSDTCVVVAHGRADTTIPFSHSERLKEGWHGKGSFNLIVLENGGHNNVLALAHGELAKALSACVGGTRAQEAAGAPRHPA